MISMSVFVNSISHPQEFLPSTGRTQLAQEIESINQSLSLLLTSAKGELFGDPEFGCNLYSYLYEFSGDLLNQLIKEDIVNTIYNQETRVVVNNKDITITDNGTSLDINITYSIKYTNYKSDYNLLIKKRSEEEV